MDHLKYGLLQHILITNKINNFMQIDLLVPLKIQYLLDKVKRESTYEENNNIKMSSKFKSP